RGEKIRNYFGDTWNGHKIAYVEQKEQLGTWNAVYLAKDLIREKFIMLYGDDIGDKAAFTLGATHDYALFVSEKDHPERYGVVEMNADGTLKDIVEKPDDPSTNLVNSGAMILMPEVFSVEPFLHSRLGEYLLTDLLAHVSKDKSVAVIKQNRWITVTYPDDVTSAEVLLKKL